MKNLFLAFLLNTIATSMVYSQSKFDLEFHLGTSAPTFIGDAKKYATDLTKAMVKNTGIDIDFKKSFRFFPINVGGYIGYNLTNWFSIHAGIESLPKGVRYFGTFVDPSQAPSLVQYNLNTIFKINYLEFPIGLKLSTKSKNNPDKAYFFIRGGIAPALKISSKYKIVTSEFNWSANTAGDSDPIKGKLEHINKNDFCQFIAIGIGSGNTNKPTIELKYEKGTKNIMDPNYSSYRFFNSSLSLNLIREF